MVVVTSHGVGGEFADANCPKQAPLAIGGGGTTDGKGGELEISASDHQALCAVAGVREEEGEETPKSATEAFEGAVKK